ncbi:MAG: rane fusion protein heavy metal efflux system [Variibacter sp.]|jgi:cobalt-zinc-cadmium efflux system membrane fusion protein|nr:rane fusion protein heavy metal efflux system [Variibacter sp.]
MPSLSNRSQILILVAAIAAGTAGFWFWPQQQAAPQKAHDVELSSQSRKKGSGGFYEPTPQQWATLSVQPIEQHGFRSEHVTEGKIVVNEDRSTLIFSPYSGRITRLMAKPGDVVKVGQPLFMVEATDVVQVQNDFLTATAALNKARSQFKHAQIVEKRTRDLYEAKALPLKDWQKAQADLTDSQNDTAAAEAAIDAVRNRLRLLGRSDAEISQFQERGKISPETPIIAPIAGTVVQRKGGPGQYLTAGVSDPVFVIGDLGTIWLTAYVRETDVPRVHVGQELLFTVLGYPDRTFTGKIDYVAASLDATTKRLLVRATVDNPEGLLKPEMFASVTIEIDQGQVSLAVPREAVIYEGDVARVWVAHEGKSIELRRIKTGLSNARFLQVVSGLDFGETVVTKGALFIDRVASSGG